jgi:hypothetical protein
MSAESDNEIQTAARKISRASENGENDDFSKFTEGDTFPYNKKKIQLIIVAEKDYIVFLDPDMYVRYWGTRELPSDFGDVLIRQANLEATSKLLLEGVQLEVFRRLLAESVGRLYDDGKSENARLMLDKAEVFLRSRSREKARGWYLSAAVVMTMAVLAAAVVLWLLRSSMLALLGASEVVIQVMLGTAIGSLGALVSVLLRSDELTIDVSAGPRVHYFEGALRIIIGCIAGFLFALAIKSNILLGTINNSDKSLSLLLLICIVAGASERLLPSLIRQLEGTLIAKVEEMEVINDQGDDSNWRSDSQQEKPRKRRRFLFRRRT